MKYQFWDGKGKYQNWSMCILENFIILTLVDLLSSLLIATGLSGSLPLYEFLFHFPSLLQNAWLNEKFSPRLLPPATEVLNCLMEQLAQLENNLVQVSKTDFRVPLHKMEVARIRYIIFIYDLYKAHGMVIFDL